MCTCRQRCYPHTWLPTHFNDTHPYYVMSPSERYVASLYFAVVTMTTTGYGDVKGHSIRDFVAVIVTVIAGMIIFAYALSVLAATLTNTDAPKYRLLFLLCSMF